MGFAHYYGEGVAHDEAKDVHYWELGAVQGDVECRHSLAVAEYSSEKDDRAVRHFLIAAKMGNKEWLDFIRKMCADGLVTKSQYAEALRGYQDAVEEMKSPQREKATRDGYMDRGYSIS